MIFCVRLNLWLYEYDEYLLYLFVVPEGRKIFIQLNFLNLMHYKNVKGRTIFIDQ